VVATHFAVITPPRATAGDSVRFFVVALDDANRVARDYAGTVAVTSSDTAATLPANYTFTAADRGVKALAATLPTTGSQTLAVTDAADAALAGSATIDVGATDSFPGFDLGGGFLGGHRPRGRR
jgi:hypothetical protein